MCFTTSRRLFPMRPLNKRSGWAAVWVLKFFFCAQKRGFLDPPDWPSRKASTSIGWESQRLAAKRRIASFFPWIFSQLWGKCCVMVKNFHCLYLPLIHHIRLPRQNRLFILHRDNLRLNLRSFATLIHF